MSIRGPRVSRPGMEVAVGLGDKAPRVRPSRPPILAASAQGCRHRNRDPAAGSTPMTSKPRSARSTAKVPVPHPTSSPVGTELVDDAYIKLKITAIGIERVIDGGKARMLELSAMAATLCRTARKNRWSCRCPHRRCRMPRCRRCHAAPPSGRPVPDLTGPMPDETVGDVADLPSPTSRAAGSRVRL